MMWSTDFPHAESDWPESQLIIEEIFAGVPDEERAQMLGGNAVDYFHLDPNVQSRGAAVASAAAGR
jgi:predicted TIM-barrel fold metal-dependent hydrolase